MYKEHKGEEGADEGHCDGAVPGMLASELLPRACMGLATVPTPRTNRAMHRLSSKVRVRLRVRAQLAQRELGHGCTQLQDLCCKLLRYVRQCTPKKPTGCMTFAQPVAATAAQAAAPTPCKLGLLVKCYKLERTKLACTYCLAANT